MYDLGEALSWWEFECWLKHLPVDTATVRKLRTLAAEEAKPEDQRVVGKASDALPLAELDEFLGWTE
ncbi:hypothetical protein ACFPPE_07335 [Agromyces tardus]|uniref:hypothetical protein n=1 Tax=Agromyces tardus TaxID=2583849 RepID=UPI0036129A37